MMALEVRELQSGLKLDSIMKARGHGSKIVRSWECGNEKKTLRTCHVGEKDPLAFNDKPSPRLRIFLRPLDFKR